MDGRDKHPGDSGPLLTEVNQRPLEAVIAEFSAVRAEIGYRSTTQHLLMNLNIVATGAIVGLAIRDQDQGDLLLLLIAIVSSALGLLYSDHARSIALLAGYVDEEMRFERDGQNLPLFPWEEYSAIKVHDQPWYAKFDIAVFLVFVAPPALALTFLHTDHRLTTGLADVAWWTGVVLSTYMTFVVGMTKFKPDVLKRGRRRLAQIRPRRRD